MPSNWLVWGKPQRSSIAELSAGKRRFRTFAGSRPKCRLTKPDHQRKEPTKRAWLIAQRKKFSLACRTLGLLYSYNSAVNGRPHREIVFSVRIQDWILHDITGVSLTMTYLITGTIGKVLGEDRF
jgi:hypothetical protein